MWEFPFTGQKGEYLMVNGALYPILASFRWFVVLDPITMKSVGVTASRDC